MRVTQIAGVLVVGAWDYSRGMIVMLRRALREAQKSPHPHFKHGTLIFRGGALIATGYNHDDRHSEEVALGKLWPGYARGSTVVNIRIKPSGRVGMARPCPRCLKILLDNRIKRCYYTNAEGKLEEL